MTETDFQFSCPHCGEIISVRIDRTGGEQQTFVHDCEICCRPIHIRFELKADEILNFAAEAES